MYYSYYVPDTVVYQSAPTVANGAPMPMIVYGPPPQPQQPQQCHQMPVGKTSKDELEYGLMEIVWHGEFDNLFRSFGQQWHLVPTIEPPEQSQTCLPSVNIPVNQVRWKTFRDSAKVRFACDTCGNGWTSMKGRVISWYCLLPEYNTGYVLFKLFGQQCKKCSTGVFEHAMWYPDEVVKVVSNLFQRIGQSYYGFTAPSLRHHRRDGKPKEQHNAQLCQACHDGCCKEELMFT